MDIKKLYNRNKEIILYLAFGMVTTVISISVFWFFTSVIPLNELVANVISFIAAVFFAFLTNRKWVFNVSHKQGFFKDAVKFYLGRLLTLLIEEVIIFVFIILLSFDSLTVKITAQIVVIILNYIISKIFVFK